MNEQKLKNARKSLWVLPLFGALFMASMILPAKLVNLYFFGRGETWKIVYDTASFSLFGLVVGLYLARMNFKELKTEAEKSQLLHSIPLESPDNSGSS